MKKCTKCKEEKQESEYHKHKRKKDGLHSRCKSCTKSDGLIYRNKEVNKERVKAYNQERMKDPEVRAKIREIAARSYRKHFERHRSAQNEKDRQRYPARKDAQAKSHQTWKREHMDLVVEYNRRRNTQKKAAPGHFTPQDWLAIKELYLFACVCCHRSEPEIKLTTDHIVPLVSGGAHSSENIQPLCRSCNSKKRRQIIDYRPWSLPVHD